MLSKGEKGMVMMKKWGQLQLILWKQYWYRHRVWLAGIAVAALVLGLTGSGNREEEEKLQGIFVGVCAQDEKGIELRNRLTGKEGIFRFLPYEEEETLRRDVENGTLECGYLFSEGFFEHMVEGKVRRQILMYYSPGSTAHKISYEVVFAELFHMLSDEVLRGYAASGILSGEGAKGEVLAEELLAEKERYETNGSTFTMQYELLEEKHKPGTGEDASGVAALDVPRGCIALVIFFMSLMGLAGCMELTEKSRCCFGAREAAVIRESSLHIAMAGSILSGALLLWASGSFGEMGREAAGLLFYFLVLEGYLRCYLLVLKKPGRVYALMPVLLLGSLLLCPVFFRLEVYFPAAVWLQKLFPVSWYLNFT